MCTTTSEYIWLPYNYIWRFWFRYFFVFKFLFALFWFQFVFLLINDDVLLLLNIDFLSTAKYLVHISSVLWLLLTRRKSRFFLIYGSRMGGPLRLFIFFFHCKRVLFDLFLMKMNSHWASLIRVSPNALLFVLHCYFDFYG